jgi:6-phosphogluconolactonase/glucosamine-6-phosphate isomerase/deaminase
MKNLNQTLETEAENDHPQSNLRLLLRNINKSLQITAKTTVYPIALAKELEETNQLTNERRECKNEKA